MRNDSPDGHPETSGWVLHIIQPLSLTETERAAVNKEYKAILERL
jgi:hypothetical protein